MTFDPTQPVITAVGLVPLKQFMQQRGLDWRHSLEDVGIDPDMAVDIDAMVPLQSAFELLENGARKSGNEAFGLQFGEILPVNITGALAYITLNAPDLRTFCKDSVRFLGLVAYGYTARFEEADALSHLIYEIPYQHGSRTQFLDMIFAASARRFRHVAQDPSIQIHFDIEHAAPRNVAEFHRVLGRNVRFDQGTNRVGLDTRHLSKPLPAADPELYRIVRQHAEEKIDKREKTRSLVYCVTDYIADALKHGDATLAEAADTLGMSSRALQRELEKANTTFRDLVEETRKSLARHFLYDTSLPLTEIAFILGFSELSAFSRAARSWFGVSPRELRKVGTERAGF
jgi:AraC-like DNA-binding protein